MLKEHRCWVGKHSIARRHQQRFKSCHDAAAGRSGFQLRRHACKLLALCQSLVLQNKTSLYVRDSLCARSRRDLWCKRCSRGDVLTADLKSEDSWLVALALKGSLSILCIVLHILSYYWLHKEQSLMASGAMPR